MPIFPFFRLSRAAARAVEQEREGTPAGEFTPPAPSPTVRRHFFNTGAFQTYASFFPLWGGWATAGHCLTETNGLVPTFANGPVLQRPDGLDAALIGCRLPEARPAAPREGQDVVAHGFPAGSQHAERRRGRVYYQRSPGQWIVQMEDGAEPVVVGMSGGPVLDARSGAPIGILITRNSPADLDADGDADESYDFTALSDVWDAAGLVA